MNWEKMLKKILPQGTPINYDRITDSYVSGTLVKNTDLTPFYILITQELIENITFSKIKIDISNRNSEIYLFKIKSLFFEMYYEVYFSPETIRIIQNRSVHLDREETKINKFFLLYLENDFKQREALRLPLLLGSMHIIIDGKKYQRKGIR